MVPAPLMATSVPGGRGFADVARLVPRVRWERVSSGVTERLISVTGSVDAGPTVTRLTATATGLELTSFSTMRVTICAKHSVALSSSSPLQHLSSNKSRRWLNALLLLFRMRLMYRKRSSTVGNCLSTWYFPDRAALARSKNSEMCSVG